MKLRIGYILCIFLVVDSCFLVADQDDEKISGITNYVHLAVAVVRNCYQYFKKDISTLDLQKDVLDIPYKNIVYTQTQLINQLFDDANRHDNPLLQIRAIIVLCRIAVPEQYIKSFQKGLDNLYVLCFDEQGNFKEANQISDIRLLFKDYCKKAPLCWQDIAKSSDWWFKNKKLSALHTSYYAQTSTEFNEDLLRMIQADQLQDFVYLKYLLHKNGSNAAHKIYEYHCAQFLKKS